MPQLLGSVELFVSYDGRESILGLGAVSCGLVAGFCALFSHDHA